MCYGTSCTRTTRTQTGCAQLPWCIRQGSGAAQQSLQVLRLCDCLSRLAPTAGMHELHAIDVACLFAPHVWYWVSALFFEAAGPWLRRRGYELQPGGHHDAGKQLVTRGSVVRTVMMQHTVSIGINWAFLAFVDGSCHGRQLPPWPVVGLQFIAGMILIDAWLFWMHLLMHRNRWLYRNFHAWHHRIHAPYAFSAQYNHPVEGLLLDITSGLWPLLLLRLDARVAAALFSFTNIKIVDDHSGFSLPFDPLQRLFANNARFHDLHHQPKHARWNLSQPFFVWWDRLVGTLADDCYYAGNNRGDVRKKLP